MSTIILFIFRCTLNFRAKTRFVTYLYLHVVIYLLYHWEKEIFKRSLVKIVILFLVTRVARFRKSKYIKYNLSEITIFKYFYI